MEEKVNAELVFEGGFEPVCFAGGAFGFVLVDEEEFTAVDFAEGGVGVIDFGVGESLWVYFCAVFLFLWRDPLIDNIQIAIRIIVGSDKQKISMAPLDFGLGLAGQVKFVVDLFWLGWKEARRMSSLEDRFHSVQPGDEIIIDIVVFYEL